MMLRSKVCSMNSIFLQKFGCEHIRLSRRYASAEEKQWTFRRYNSFCSSSSFITVNRRWMHNQGFRGGGLENDFIFRRSQESSKNV
jgi:hypothetical protein